MKKKKKEIMAMDISLVKQKEEKNEFELVESLINFYIDVIKVNSL